MVDVEDQTVSSRRRWVVWVQEEVGVEMCEPVRRLKEGGT